jgi:signal transduction histidine kinase
MMRRFALTVLLPGIVLLLFGLRALQQDRLAVEHQIRDRLANTAELAARTVDQQLANWQQFRSDGVILTGQPLRAVPSDAPAYEFQDSPTVPEPDPALADAERQELLGEWDKAIMLYQRAARESSRARTQSLLRKAETYIKAGKPDLAATDYTTLLQQPDERIGGLDTQLVARFQLCMLGKGDRVAFYRDLVGGRWRLNEARYLFYSEVARAWVPESEPARAVEARKLELSAAIDSYLQNQSRVLAGHVAFWSDTETLILPAAKLLERLNESVAIDRDLRVQLAALETAPPPLSATHALRDRHLPWFVLVYPTDPSRLFAGSEQRRLIYLALLVLMFLVLAIGSYLTARAVNRELEVARLKSEFVATVSHEFRTPVTAIRQLSELLDRGRVAEEEKRRQYYSLIYRESGRLARLVENLLDFSRIEEGRKQYHLEPLDPTQWLQEVGTNFGRGNINLSVPAGLPTLQGDRAALTSAVENLLDNAVKYSPPGSPIALEAEAGCAELTIRVRDQGYGISDEDRSHIFERFYRGRGEISRQVKGAGVGLSLVRRIVEAHHGHIDFDSYLGKGSEFRIRLKTI